MGGEAALSVEARFLEPDLPIELDDAYAQTFDRLRRLFRARGCTPEEAADLAQEAAVRAFLHIRRWGVATGGLDPLLNRISRNLLIDRYRRVSPHLVPLDSASDLHDPEQDLTEEVARRQRRRDVHHAIRALPSRHQAAITYSLSGMSPEEVGKELGIGRNAADALLHRARRSLKEHLAPVREGMWGIALAFRVRFDRVMRRVGVDDRVAEGARSVLVQTGAGIAAAVVVATLGLSGGGHVGTPITHTPAISVTQSEESAAPAAVSGDAATNGSDAGGANVSGGPGESGAGSDVYQFGGAAAGGSFGHRQMDAHAAVPGPGGSPLLPLLQVRSYPEAADSYEGPGAALLNPILDKVCTTAPGCRG